MVVKPFTRTIPKQEFLFGEFSLLCMSRGGKVHRRPMGKERKEDECGGFVGNRRR
jgi:hypothetical protein